MWSVIVWCRDSFSTVVGAVTGISVLGNSFEEEIRGYINEIFD